MIGILIELVAATQSLAINSDNLGGQCKPECLQILDQTLAELVEIDGLEDV
jgi:hypothetical protein